MVETRTSPDYSHTISTTTSTISSGAGNYSTTTTSGPYTTTTGPYSTTVTTGPHTTTTGSSITTTQQSSAPRAPDQHRREAKMSDHPRPNEMGFGYGEDAAQHQAHADHEHVHHWGMSVRNEEILFYAWAIPSWCFNIAAGVLGSYYSTSNHVFIICAAIFQFLSWAAWWQTAVQMLQRASWVRDEGNLVDRRRYLHLAVRLQRLMLVCFARIFFSTFCLRETVRER